MTSLAYHRALRNVFRVALSPRSVSAAVLLAAVTVAGCSTGSKFGSDAGGRSLAETVVAGQASKIAVPSAQTTIAVLPSSPTTVNETAELHTAQVLLAEPTGTEAHSTAPVTTVPFAHIPLAVFPDLHDWRRGDGWFAMRDLRAAELLIENGCLYLLTSESGPQKNQVRKHNLSLPWRYTRYDPKSQELYSDEHGPMKSGDPVVLTWFGDLYDPDETYNDDTRSLREACPADGWTTATGIEPISPGLLSLADFSSLTDWHRGDPFPAGRSYNVSDSTEDMLIENGCLYLLSSKHKSAAQRHDLRLPVRYNLRLPVRYTRYDPASQELYSDEHGPMRSGDVVITAWTGGLYRSGQYSDSMPPLSVREACPADGWAETTGIRPAVPAS